ncbi:hypothetical protein Nepgr_009720 [Nepenthes gracilis]|uniref:Uncharacterized protein n=1 Tax=Nepenthes gracilis TaxID=150966 RepID=A0AAD3SB19_NEPGR|nr:hypothetical protein Nepgr_009720 [Nepenthes gracilis]
MPRTTTVECPGCPPLRALTFDSLGLVKVIEARENQGGIPKVVERWGDPDSSKCIIAASIDDSKSNPLLAVARKNGMIELLSPLNGQLGLSISDADKTGVSPEDDPIVGLHLFKRRRLESYPSSHTLFTCTTKGNASLKSIEVPNAPTDSVPANPPKTWSVCGSGDIVCCKVDDSENYSIFGGKGVEVNMWDLENTSKIWSAKSPPKNSLGIFTPTWFTSVTFLNKDDHRKFVAGTNSHQIRLYDASIQRRPVLSFDFKEVPIKAVAEDLDGHTIYFGNGSGDLASIDIRTGKLLGCFLGKCSGSIRSIVRHPKLPIIASCGLDSYLRFWDINSRQLLSAVFLKQQLTNVVFDSNFVVEEALVAVVRDQWPDELQDRKENLNKAEESRPVKRKKACKESSSRSKKLEPKKLLQTFGSSGIFDRKKNERIELSANGVNCISSTPSLLFPPALISDLPTLRRYSISSRISILLSYRSSCLEVVNFGSSLLKMVVKSWLHNLWRTSQKQENACEKVPIGVLSFEVASLMSKLVHLSLSLSDKQVIRLREEIANSLGIKKLISEDDDYIIQLICAEMLYNLGNIGKDVARLGKKCDDPKMSSLEHLFNDLIEVGQDLYGLEFSWKKMERMTKKMEKLISSNANLYQEIEMLVELEQTLRRMQMSVDMDDKKLLEYHKKVEWKRREVKNLQGISLWNKTYDYTVSLMTRSIFTIGIRIKHVFGISQRGFVGELKDSRLFDSDYIHRNQSVSAFLQSSVHPFDSGIARFASGPLHNTVTQLDPITKSPMYKLASGHFGSLTSKSGPIHPTNNILNFHSGPLEKSSTKSSPISQRSIFGLKLWQFHRNSSARPLKGCMIGGGNAQFEGNDHSKRNSNILNLTSGCRFLDAPPETLGAAALALHYANIIIAIEKLFASPHLIGCEARDDLYNMLPSSLRTALRARLKPLGKRLASSEYDTVLAGEWKDAMARILEWLAPLAHNMIRWQSERSFERQNSWARRNVILVQTLYFANREKTEAIIAELLVGLNYIWRLGRETNAKAFLKCASSSKFGDYLYEDSGSNLGFSLGDIGKEFKYKNISSYRIKGSLLT